MRHRQGQPQAVGYRQAIQPGPGTRLISQTTRAAGHRMRRAPQNTQTLLIKVMPHVAQNARRQLIYSVYLAKCVYM